MASVVRLCGALVVSARLVGALEALIEGAREGRSETGLMTAVEIEPQAGARLQNTEARPLAVGKARCRATRDQTGEPVSVR
jgi:hypothetical protein